MKRVVVGRYLPQLILGNSANISLKLFLKAASLTMGVSSSSPGLTRDGMVTSRGLDRRGIWFAKCYPRKCQSEIASGTRRADYVSGPCA
jgi:hypothetical protein